MKSAKLKPLKVYQYKSAIIGIRVLIRVLSNWLETKIYITTNNTTGPTICKTVKYKQTNSETQ